MSNSWCRAVGFVAMACVLGKAGAIGVAMENGVDLAFCATGTSSSIASKRPFFSGNFAVAKSFVTLRSRSSSNAAVRGVVMAAEVRGLISLSTAQGFEFARV